MIKNLMQLPCNICGKPMEMFKKENITRFKCKTNDCQTWTISEDGSYDGCKILANLWPSNMDENSKYYRENYIPERRKEMEFYPLARLIAGYMTQDDYNLKMEEIDKMFDEWYKSHPVKKSWFERLFCK